MSIATFMYYLPDSIESLPRPQNQSNTWAPLQFFVIQDKQDTFDLGHMRDKKKKKPVMLQNLKSEHQKHVLKNLTMSCARFFGNRLPLTKSPAEGLWGSTLEK